MSSTDHKAFLRGLKKAAHGGAEPISVGRVSDVVGLSISVVDLRLPIGSLCEIDRPGGIPLACEVVSLREDEKGRQLAIVMPYGEPERIHAHAPVRATLKSPTAPVGRELLGRILNGLGEPLDVETKGELSVRRRRSFQAAVAHPLRRRVIDTALPTGVRAIDAFMTIGRGQRVSITAGSGVGKSTLLSMIAKDNAADVNVVALVGERNREVQDFLANGLGPEGLARSVVVVATSDEPALIRLRAAQLAAVIAEDFRDQGLDVSFFCDSVTRYAQAQREIGAAAGELGGQKSYPASVYRMLPALLERSGMGEVGSITGFYTVLVEADETTDDLIADIVRGHLDGHIVLDRSLHAQNHMPPIDIVASLSRVMPAITTEAHRMDANLIRAVVASYRANYEQINSNLWKRGLDLKVDAAIELLPFLNPFLQQRPQDRSPYEVTVEILHHMAEAAARIAGVPTSLDTDAAETRPRPEATADAEVNEVAFAQGPGGAVDV